MCPGFVTGSSTRDNHQKTQRRPASGTIAGGGRMSDREARMGLGADKPHKEGKKTPPAAGIGRKKGVPNVGPRRQRTKFLGPLAPPEKTLSFRERMRQIADDHFAPLLESILSNPNESPHLRMQAAVAAVQWGYGLAPKSDEGERAQQQADGVKSLRAKLETKKPPQ